MEAATGRRDQGHPLRGRLGKRLQRLQRLHHPHHQTQTRRTHGPRFQSHLSQHCEDNPPRLDQILYKEDCRGQAT